MQQIDIFDQARSSINRRTVEYLFPGGHWRGAEYLVLSPLRNDRNIGSFSISDEGIYHDFATDDSGDLIDLVLKTRQVDKVKAAEIIVRASGGSVAHSPLASIGHTSRTAEKPDAIIPIPEEMIDLFRPDGAAGVWTYRDQAGGAWCAVARFNEPNGGKRVIPYYFDGQAWEKGNPIATNRPLFNVDKLAGNTLPVLVMEGEKCASQSVEGYICVTWIGGCKAVHKSDFSPLNDRKVIIWPDADEPGLAAAKKIKALLPHAQLLHIEGHADGWDCADALAEGINPVSFIDECRRVAYTASSDISENNDVVEKRGRPRKSNQAMELLKHYPLCRCMDKRYMIRGNQALQIGSRSYKDFVAGVYYRTTGEPLTSVQIDEVASIHRARAGESEEREVYIRTASPAGHVCYIDLNDGKNTIIEVDKDGWRIAENPPVLFIRPVNMGALPMPDHNGSIEPLRRALNIEKEEDFPVLVASLCYTLRGRPYNRGAYPITVVTGIEGSAKTTFMKIIKTMVDPGTPETRTPPSDNKDLFIAANNCLVLSLDNLSYINRSMSDALCSLATGGGFARKMNYSDDEEQIFYISRPVYLNGISFDRMPDLMSRSISIELHPISPEDRKTEEEIWSYIKAHHSSVLGGLLTMVSRAMREEALMKDEKLDLPRLADFGRFSIALERGNGMEVGRIIATLKASYEAALGDNAEGNPVIPIIIEIVEENIIWSGSASELLKAVNEKGDDADKRLSLWPKTAEQLGKHLKRNHNVYASQGVSITQTRLKTGRIWELAIKRNHQIEEEAPDYDEIPLMC